MKEKTPKQFFVWFDKEKRIKRNSKAEKDHFGSSEQDKVGLYWRPFFYGKRRLLHPLYPKKITETYGPTQDDDRERI